MSHAQELLYASPLQLVSAEGTFECRAFYDFATWRVALTIRPVSGGANAAIYSFNPSKSHAADGRVTFNHLGLDTENSYHEITGLDAKAFNIIRARSLALQKEIRRRLDAMSEGASAHFYGDAGEPQRPKFSEHMGANVIQLILRSS